MFVVPGSSLPKGVIISGFNNEFRISSNAKPAKQDCNAFSKPICFSCIYAYDAVLFSFAVQFAENQHQVSELQIQLQPVVKRAKTFLQHLKLLKLSRE